MIADRQRLATLIDQAGGSRRAAELITAVRGAAPTHSALYKAARGSGTDYTVQCYIDDLTAALSSPAPEPPQR